jgi:hypothetical protein
LKTVNFKLTLPSLALHHLLSNHRPLSSYAAAAGQQHMASQQQLIQLASLLTPPHTVLELAVSSTGILKRIKNFAFPKSFI